MAKYDYKREVGSFVALLDKLPSCTKQLTEQQSLHKHFGEALQAIAHIKTRLLAKRFCVAVAGAAEGGVSVKQLPS